MLGICYGMQAMVLELGGRVEGAEVGEFGRSQLTVSEPGRLLAGLPHEQSCWMSHRDTVFEAPPGFTALAASTESPVAALEDPERGPVRDPVPPRGGAHARTAPRSSRRFLRDICGLSMDWSAASIAEEQIERIRAQVGDGKVICGLSGGVDSSVAALLTYKAVGDQLTCVFVDHGLMRKNEGEQVVKAVPRRLQGAARGGRRRGALPRAAWRASPSPRPSARSSARSSSAASRRRPPSSTTRASWSRARSTRT